MNTYNAWEFDAEAKRVLEAVGITDLSKKIKDVGRVHHGMGRVCSMACGSCAPWHGEGVHHGIWVVCTMAWGGCAPWHVGRVHHGMGRM